MKHFLSATSAVAISLGLLIAMPATTRADVVHVDDTIVQGSLCVGFDCVNGENFGFDTMRLKENNLRIHFDDTSSSGSFPRNDWRIVVNDSSNGGASYFSVEDSTAGRTPFRIDAGAPANSLRIDSGGDVGIGVDNPGVPLHVRDGNTPTLRLEQDGSSGFTPQIFDVAANEANFFIRDVTNGSALPFRIQPGADENSLYISANNNIGIGTASPAARIHVSEAAALTAANPHILVNNTNSTPGNRRMLGVSNNGGGFIHMENRQSGAIWTLVNANSGTAFLINEPNDPETEFALEQNGDLTISGTLTTGSNTAYPDYVFEPGYELLSLSELSEFIASNGHLPRVPTAEEVSVNGVNVSQLQILLLEKVEELTLYTIDQEQRILELQAALERR